MGSRVAPSGRRSVRAGFVFGLCCCAALLVCGAVFWAQLRATKLLAARYLGLAAAALGVLLALCLLGVCLLRKKKAGPVLCGCAALIFSAALVYGAVTVGSVRSTVENIADEGREGVLVDVIVRTDDPASSLADLAGYTVGVVRELDWANTQRAMTELQSAAAVEQTAYDDVSALADALLSGETGAVVLNEAYVDSLESLEAYADFSDRTRVLHSFIYEDEIQLQPAASDGDLTARPFVVYLSGSDARDTNINVRARSDSNILAVVNPQTHQILLLNTPRDYYVPLAFNGRMDKLTHAGIYGIAESVHTLENLYDVTVDRYARINFYGLVDLVDAVGGVDVYSDYELTLSTNACSKSGDVDRTVHKGMNHFDGAKALAFSRERHKYSDGDNQRGRNQMAVIQALLKKLSSPSILLQYQRILDAVSSNTTTNFTYDEIAAFVQLQLQSGADWNIQTYAVTQGAGSTTQPCYSLGGASAWVMPRSDASVSAAKERIQTVLTGGTLDQN